MAEKKQWAEPVEEYLQALQTRRRQRLNALKDEIGSQADFIDKTDKHQTLVSQALSGKKPIGEALARDFEYRCGKPFGWLDVDRAGEARLPAPTTKATPWPFAFSLETWSELPGEARKAIRAAAAEIVIEIHEQSKPTRKVAAKKRKAAA